MKIAPYWLGVSINLTWKIPSRRGTLPSPSETENTGVASEALWKKDMVRATGPSTGAPFSLVRRPSHTNSKESSAKAGSVCNSVTHPSKNLIMYLAIFTVSSCQSVRFIAHSADHEIHSLGSEAIPCLRGSLSFAMGGVRLPLGISLGLLK